MAKSKLIQANKKIAEKVTGTFEKMEDAVVGGYKKWKMPSLTVTLQTTVKQ